MKKKCEQGSSEQGSEEIIGESSEEIIGESSEKSDIPLSSFCCGGSIKDFNKFLLFYTYDDAGVKKSSKVEFPVPTEEELKELISHSKKATFGKGEENVLDETYRKAFSIEGQNVGLSYDFYNVINPIKQLIINIMCAEANQLEAKLYNLNIYEKGGFFHSHVDTPKQDAFATLVVFLPSKFKVDYFY